ncbi:MAG: tetratricopeptide repeat protein [Deltaproteobacteria bacterium]|nr:tetratricopeptide repeat protein [Deltaproteobacteria bacterium]
MHAQAATDCRSQHQLNLRLLRFTASPQREEPVMLAQDLLAAKRPVDALQVVEAAMERDPDDSDLLLTLGVALFRSGEVEWARRVLVKAVSADEEWAEPWRWLGETLIEAGDRDRGVQALIRAQALDGSDSQVAQILRRLARQDEVGAQIARFFARPELVDPALLLQDLIEDERFDDATKVLGIALADEDDDPDLLLLKGRVERARGQLEAAKDSFERATELDPGWAEAWTELEELYLEGGDEDGAREVARHRQAAQQQAEEHARAASIARENQRAAKRVAEERRAAAEAAAEEKRAADAGAVVQLTTKLTTVRDEKASAEELSARDRITIDTDGAMDALIEMQIEVQLDSFDEEAAEDSIEMHIEVQLDGLDDAIALEAHAQAQAAAQAAQAEAEAEAEALAEAEAEILARTEAAAREDARAQAREEARARVEAELEARIIDEQAAEAARACEAAKATAQKEAFERAFNQAELEARKRAAEAKVLKLEAEARARADKEQAQRRAKIASERADVVASIRLAREAAFKQARVEAERRVAGSEEPSTEDLEAAANARAAVEAAALARRKAVREAEARARVRAEKERWEAAATARAEEAEELRQKARQAAAAQKRWEATASSREAAGQRALSLAIKFVDDARKRAAAAAAAESINVDSDDGAVFELSTLKQAAPEAVFELCRPVFTGAGIASAEPGNIDAMLDHLLDELLEELGQEPGGDTLPGMPLAGTCDGDGGVGMTQADQSLRLRGEGAVPYQPTSSSGFLAAQTQPGITAPVDATV